MKKEARRGDASGPGRCGCGEVRGAVKRRVESR